MIVLVSESLYAVMPKGDLQRDAAPLRLSNLLIVGGHGVKRYLPPTVETIVLMKGAEPRQKSATAIENQIQGLFLIL